ncbi:MAG: recombinase RecQ, partial [Microbacterium sp.]
DWGWATRPAAVVAMPSRSRPALVTSLARTIAEVGRLPLLGSLELTGAGPGGSGGNSAYRLAGVARSFAVGPELAGAIAGLDGAPILLVDDLVDSRWSVTVAGRLLRQAGSGPVLPFVLAVRA